MTIQERKDLWISLFYSFLSLIGIIAFCYFALAPLADAHAAVMPNFNDWMHTVSPDVDDAHGCSIGGGPYFGSIINNYQRVSNANVDSCHGDFAFYFLAPESTGVWHWGTAWYDSITATSGSTVPGYEDSYNGNLFLLNNGVGLLGWDSTTVTSVCLVALETGTSLSGDEQTSFWNYWTGVTTTIPTFTTTWKCWNWSTQDDFVQRFELTGPAKGEVVGANFLATLWVEGFEVDEALIQCWNTTTSYTDYIGNPAIVASQTVTSTMSVFSKFNESSVNAIQMPTATVSGPWSCAAYGWDKYTNQVVNSNTTLFSVDASVSSTPQIGTANPYSNPDSTGFALTKTHQAWNDMITTGLRKLGCFEKCSNLLTTFGSCMKQYFFCPDSDFIANSVSSVYHLAADNEIVSVVLDDVNSSVGYTTVSSATWTVKQRDGSSGFTLSIKTFHDFIETKIAANTNVAGILSVFKWWMTILGSVAFAWSIIAVVRDTGVV